MHHTLSNIEAHKLAKLPPHLFELDSMVSREENIRPFSSLGQVIDPSEKAL